MKRLLALMGLATLSTLVFGAPAAPSEALGDYRWLLASPLRPELSAAAELYIVERYGDPGNQRGVSDRRPDPDSDRVKALSQLINDRSQDKENPNLTRQDETAIALHGQNIVIGYNDSIGFAAGTASGTGYAYSHDGGNTWIDGGELQTPPGHDSLGDPALTVDRQGNFYFASITFYPDGVSYIGIAKSTDGGETWPQYTDASPGVDPANFQDKEFITVDKSGGPCDGTVYVSWTEFFAAGGNRILVTRSYDGGRTFSWPVQVSPPGQGVQASFPRVGPSGELYVVWRDGTTPGIRVSKSTDCGRTFGADGVRNVLVSKTVPYVTFSPECGRTTLKGHIRASTSPALSIDQRNGWLYVAYPSNPPGLDQSDVYLVRSEDGGKTWSTPVRVHDDQSNSDQFFPTVAVAGDGTVGVAFYDRRNDPNNLTMDVYLAVSTDGGKTFSPNKRLSEVSFSMMKALSISGCYMGDYIYIEADDEYFYTTWGDGRNEGRSWALRTPMNHPRVGSAVAAVGKMVYSIGGTYLLTNETTDTNRNEMYDTTADRWITRASALTARSGAMAASQGGFVYVLGGISTDRGQALGSVERYNALLDLWELLPSMPTARTGIGVAIVNNVIYAIGGSDCVNYFSCNSALDKVEAYDIRTGKWITKASMPTPRAEAQATVALDGKIYVFGGYNRLKGQMLSTVEIYDTATDTWEALPNLPSARSSAQAAVCGKNIIVFGGYTPQFALRATVSIYERESKKWKPGPSMRLARAEFQGANVGNKIYAVGGLDDSSLRRNGAIEAFDCGNDPIGFSRPDFDIYFSKDRVHPGGTNDETSSDGSQAPSKPKIDNFGLEPSGEFVVEGQGIATVNVQVWNLSGQLVFSGTTRNGVLKFNGLNSRGQRLANGVYLYAITAQDKNGQTERTKLQKLLLRP